MGSITSLLTDAQVEAVYSTNCNYIEDKDSDKCAAFISACLELIRRSASGMAKGANSLSYDRRMLQDQLEAARRWLEVHPRGTNNYDRGGPSVTRVDFSGGGWRGP